MNVHAKPTKQQCKSMLTHVKINENPLLPLVAFVVVIICVLVVIIVVAIVAIIVIVIGVSVSSS